MFRLHNDARTFFKAIADDLRKVGDNVAIFDQYYFCFIAGIAAGRERMMGVKDGDVFIEYFPGDKPGGYRDRAELILALLLAAELRRERIVIRRGQVDAANKRRVHETVAKLLDPRTASNLKPEGAARMNAYASGGIQVLQEEWFEEPPKSLEFFLMRFKEKLEPHAAKFGSVFLAK